MEWISIEDRLPELERPVWMYVDNRIMMGCRSEIEYKTWLWCRLHDIPYYSEHYKDMYGYPWDFDPISDDDYQPTHWMPLPEPPKD